VKVSQLADTFGGGKLVAIHIEMLEFRTKSEQVELGEVVAAQVE
jgi:hypothetical protein